MLNRLKILAELCVVAVTAFFLAEAAFSIVGGTPVATDDDQAAVVAPAPPAVKREPLSAFNEIAKRNVFDAQLRKPKPKPKPKPQKPADTITELPVSASLNLLGTVYSMDDALRRAIIQTGNDQKILRQGDKIGGYVIDDIRRRAVVVERGSKREVIVIDKDDASVASRASSMRPLSRKELDGYFGDLAKVADDVRIAPVRQGKSGALAVTSLREGSPLFEAGLRPRDVLLSANGRTLSDPADLLRLRDMLRENRITLEIMRDKSPLTLNLEIVN